MTSLKSRIVHYHGESLTVPQWRDKLGIVKVGAYCIYQRIFRYEWPLDLAFTDKRIYKQKLKEKSLIKERIREERIDNGVESWHDLMLVRGYFRKENRIKVYKQLNAWYKEFRAQDMRAV